MTTRNYREVSTDISYQNEAFSQNKDSIRLLSDEKCKGIVEGIKTHMSDEGLLFVNIVSWWSGSQRWARNKASLTSDQRDITISVERIVGGSRVFLITNQHDSESLRGIAGLAEHYAQKNAGNVGTEMALEIPKWNSSGTNVWSDSTFNRTAEENGVAVAELARMSVKDGLLSSGYIESFGANTYRYSRDQWNRESLVNGRHTQMQCSVTVRHPNGTGSGWTGKSSFDLADVDIHSLAQNAYDRCIRTLDPVRIEPGRYQTILEPQATQEFARLLLEALNRRPPELSPAYPTSLGYDQSLSRFRSKLGMRFVDERITMKHDPSDPRTGTHLEPGIDPVTILEKGILRTLINSYGHSVSQESSLTYAGPRASYSIEGTDISVEEMIESTKRGLLMAKVSVSTLVDKMSLLYTGTTRDGLWLIENGKITKPVRNFRWTESPLFVFNNIEQIGISESVFTPQVNRNATRGGLQFGVPRVVVPTLKVNDFSFTSTIDAI